MRKTKSYIVNEKTFELIKGNIVDYDEIDRMVAILCGHETFAAGKLGDIPIYVSGGVRDGEIMAIEQDVAE